jgi:hypothetical protein
MSNVKWEELTPSQQAWVYGKAGWEHMAILAVLAEYEVPPPEHLNNDGTARRCSNCRNDRAAWDHRSAVEEPTNAE